MHGSASDFWENLTGDRGGRGSGAGPLESLEDNLQRILCTRRMVEVDAGRFPEARRSVLAYGIPSRTRLRAGSPREAAVFASEIETALRVFEPRLKDIGVAGRTGADGGSDDLRIDIDARLRSEARSVDVYAGFDGESGLVTVQESAEG